MTGSSPEADNAEADPAEASQSDAQNSAASSAATEGTGEKSLLDSVTDALGAREQEPSPSSERDQVDPAAPQSQKDGTAQAATAEEPLGDLTEEELKRYGPKTQRRMRQLLTERLDASQKATALEPKAQAYDKIVDYARSNKMSNEEVGIALELGALIKNEPSQAFERLTPIYRKLAEMVGAVLPDDLQEQVNLGYLTKEHASELARLRGTKSLTETKLKETTEEREVARQREQTEAHVNACRNTANAWEAARKGSDPDWNLKQEEIGRRVRLAVLEKGYPQTQDGVVQMLDGILKDVNQWLVRLRPPPKETRPVTGTASSRSSVEPKSALEAAEMALSTRS